MAPKHASTGPRIRYRCICQLGPNLTTGGPQGSEYSGRTRSIGRWLLAVMPVSLVRAQGLVQGLVII